MKTLIYNPETHVLVPREPSEDMLQAATADSCWEDMNPPPSVAYRSMLAAAPQPEPLGEPFSTILRENLDSLYEADGKPHKPVDVDPVAYIDCESPTGVSLAPSAKGLCDGDSLYTTPQPDRTAELEAALKVAREALDDCAANYLHADSVLTDKALAKINEVMK